MSIRDTLNRNGAIVTGAVILLIAGAGYFLFRQVKDLTPRAEDQAFYTIDDGNSWFLDDLSKVPPFETGGKTAVKAYVYKCKDGKPFVGYLEQYNESVKKELIAFQAEAKKTPNDMARIQGLLMSGVQYKKPGDKEWGKGAVQVACPSGNAADLERVIPGQ